MMRFRSRAIAISAVALAVLGGTAFSAQDKYALKVPDGPAFSEIRGYEGWSVVATSRPTEDGSTQLKIILGNPAMIAAYRAGIPGNGKPFPDGAKIVKLVYKPKQNAVAPYPVEVPDTLLAVAFIEKDGKRFADTNGWGFGEFAYDPANDAFKPGVQGHNCGAACHQAAKATDFIFTAYAKR